MRYTPISAKHLGKIHEKIKFGSITAEIRMDASGVFGCRFNGDERTGTLPTIRDWANKRVMESVNLKWVPIMEVACAMEDDVVNGLEHCANVSLRLERFYIAWDGARWIECDWVVPKANCVCFNSTPSNREQDEFDKMDEQELAGPDLDKEVDRQMKKSCQPKLKKSQP